MTKSVDLLLSNAIVLTMDSDMNMYEPGAVAVNGNAIVAVGPEKDIKSKYTGKETIDCGGKVLMPGLINAHTHVPMTLLRGLSDDVRLDVWLMGYIMPVEREFITPDAVRLGTSIGSAEFIRSGITAFNDMYYFESTVAEATAQAGLRAVCGQTILKFPAPDAESYEDSLAQARSFIEEWKDHELIVPAVAPHAIYSSTPDLIQSSAALAAEFDVPLHMHIAETSFEVENAREEFDMPVVPYVKKLNLFDAKVIAAHCVHIDSGEIKTLLHHHAGVAHNPSSNMKLSSGAAPVAEMLAAGLNVGIGTDGPSSNNDLDMFEEVRLATFLSNLSTNDPTSLPAITALLMATRMGAQALHIGDLTGSLEVKKRADLILVDINKLHNSPRFSHNPNGIYSQLVYASKSTDVTDVMVNGNWLMRDYIIEHINEQDLIDEAQDYSKVVDQFISIREKSVLSKLITISGATEAESFEVQLKVRLDNPDKVIKALESDEIEIIYDRHYREYDTYFIFDDASQGQLRYREDEFMNANGEIEHVRYRLTLLGEPHEQEFPSDVVLSRSRYLTLADQSLRFYREYFKPDREIEVHKDRLRWRVKFQETELYVNIDRLDKPDLGHFLEIKSRTWSQKDAEKKSKLVLALLKFLGASEDESESREYVLLGAEK